MNFSILGSGSKGNCALIESGSTAILVDAGFSGKEISRRLKLINRSPDDLTAILITHEHGDHISGAGVLSRRCGLPVHANAGTHRAAEAKIKKLHQGNEFETGTDFIVDDLQIHPFRISHDTSDPVGFVVSDGRSSICCCTDTGKITTLIRQQARQCQALIVEANYDQQMLQSGPYPMYIKQRVKSNQGHLGNDDTARFLAELLDTHLQKVILAHISQTNNLPELVRARIQQEIEHLKPQFSLDMASQDAPTPLFSLRS
ncbi:MAG: MBL fold metallo-hydrolase [Candidatus Electrothrix sp. AR3]|nr:MBL fold metallo-hydrolase [Candidatus Electrothrix sp. AR3]